MPFPHYFVPSDAEEAAPLGQDPLVCVVDAFDVEAPHLHPLEVVVGVNADGALGFAAGSSVRERLAPGALKQLHFEEMATPPRRRMIDARQLFLFDLQLVEQVSTAPDLNDPVYLYGTLVGPIDGERAMSTKGQLTVTRADLFQGLVGARPWAFRYPSLGSSPSVCHHAWLAAGRDADVAAGEGLVLAYPLIIGVAGDDLENTAVVQLMLDEALSALRGDLFAFDQKRSAVARWFVKGAGDRLRVPAGAGIDAYFALADEALALIPDWPSARSEALFRRLRASAPGARRTTTGLVSPPALERSPVELVVPARARLPPPVRSNEPPKWMQDFIAARRTQQAPGVAPEKKKQEPSHLTWTGTIPGAKPWMSDFEAPVEDEGNDAIAAEPAKPAAPGKPDWMKDFEK